MIASSLGILGECPPESHRPSRSATSVRAPRGGAEAPEPSVSPVAPLMLLYAVIQRSSRRSFLSWWSFASVFSALCALSVTSFASMLSLNSFASLLSVNSCLSVLSVNSVLSIGCTNEALRICFAS